MTGEWFTASAPGKFVILGEHAVVYGKPAVVVAVDRRITCSVRRSRKNTLNGEEVQMSHGLYGFVMHSGTREERESWFKKYYEAFIKLID